MAGKDPEEKADKKEDKIEEASAEAAEGDDSERGGDSGGESRESGEERKAPQRGTFRGRRPRRTFREREAEMREQRLAQWVPRTQLGKRVVGGEFKTIDDVLRSGEIILEPEIVDYLVPDLKNEVIYAGGSPGKGGGIRRTATKRTVRMHKSGRRFKLTAVTVIGNEDGVVGIAKASAKEHRNALEKSLEQAKTKLIRVRRGCGSWECGCGGQHSIPFKTTTTVGSVEVTLYPAPKGVGIVASTAAKKMLRLAGIKDIWVKTRGKTRTRGNLAFAVFEALKNLNRAKGDI